jgi:carbonic anhydrase
VAVLACMDLRLDPLAILGLDRAYVIRNAGGVVTDDAIRSLMLSQRLLGTTEVLLLHHTDCGLAGLDEAEVLDGIEAETGHRPPFALEAFADVDESVRRSVDRLRASPFLSRTDQIRGFVYDVGSQELREVHLPSGR